MLVDYRILIHKKLSGQATEAELCQLNEWITESPDHLKYFEDYCWIWSSMVDRPLPRAINLTSKLEEFRAIAPSKSSVQAGEFRLRMKPNIIFRLGVAASLMTVLFVSALLLHQKNKLQFQNQSPVAQLIDLPDGSQIHLDKNSSVTYDGGFFNTKRQVLLDGQAYFDVAKNPDKPFIVLATKGKIEVLGTHFNVISNKKNLVIHVSEGHVKYSYPTYANDLYAGDEIELNLITNEVTLEHQTNENAIAWFTGKLDFQNTPLAEVITDLSNFYHTDIKLSNPCMANFKFTSTLELSQQKDLKSVLDIINATFGLKYAKTGENSYQIEGVCK